MPELDLLGGRVHYDVTGDAEGPALVLCNALGTSAELWWRQVAALEGEYRIVTWDLPGHGRSSGRSLTPPSIGDLGALVARMLDEVGIARASVCGLSVGGMIALWFAAHHPQRVERLVLASTAPELGPPARWVERAQQARESMDAIVERAMSRWVTPGFMESDPEAESVVRRMVESCTADGYADACLAIADADLRPVLSSVTAPTVVLSGGDDPAISPVTAQTLADAIPGATRVEVPGTSHLLNMEQPARFNEVLKAHLSGRA